MANSNFLAPASLEHIGLVSGETAGILGEILTNGTLGNVPWKLQPRPIYSTWNLRNAEAGYDGVTGALNVSVALAFFQAQQNASGQGFTRNTISETSLSNNTGGTNATQIYIALGMGFEIDPRFFAAGDQILRYFATYMQRGDTNKVPLGLCRSWGTGAMGIQSPSAATGGAGAFFATAKNGQGMSITRFPPLGEFLFMQNQQIQVMVQSGAPKDTIYLTTDGAQLVPGVNEIPEYRFTCWLDGYFLEQVQN